MAEIVIVIVLIVANGLFALSEFAIVSSRQARLEAMVEARRRGAAAALALYRDPNSFLSTVQIGITLVSILTGLYSGSWLGSLLAADIEHLGVRPALATPAGYGIVIVCVTYLSVVIGELVPKRIALLAPESIACVVAPPMSLAARALDPAVRLLAASTELVFRAFPSVVDGKEVVSDHEIHAVVAEAEDAGVIEPAERHMISGVMRLGDEPVRGIMTPRVDVHRIDLSADAAAIRSIVTSTRHSYIPVGDGSVDTMIGVVRTRDVLHAMLDGGPLDIRGFVRPAPVVPDTAEALDALAVIRSAEVSIALVHDEHGHFEGIVTPADMLQTIVGAFRADVDPAEDGAVRRNDGTWDMPGSLAVEQMAEYLALQLPAERGYTTAAGYVLAELHQFPTVGQEIVRERWRFSVERVNGSRIDRLVARPEPS